MTYATWIFGDAFNGQNHYYMYSNLTAAAERPAAADTPAYIEARLSGVTHTITFTPRQTFDEENFLNINRFNVKF